jgi:phosphatidylserine decarboxylase
MAAAGRKIMTGILVCLLFTAGVSIMAKDGAKKHGKYAPVVQDLKDLYDDPDNKDFAKIVDTMLKSAVIPPGGWPSDPVNPKKLFIWPEKNFHDLLDFFQGWLTFVPNHENGMSYYELFYGLCYKNENALIFVETDPGLKWTRSFAKARGNYMDSCASISEHLDAMNDWKQYLGKHWNDFKPPKSNKHCKNNGFYGYKTFNDFFTRVLRDPSVRPVSYPDDDSILVSPADGLVNIVNSNLNTDSLIHTKYDEYLNIDELLAGSKYAKHFLGGTAVDSVLLPPDYHRYHSPVTGHVVESKEVDANDGFYFGMDGEFFTFSNNGNIGGYKSKYGYFGRYHRGYYIFKTDHYGYIAMVPVGLDDISSVNFAHQFKNVGSPSNPGPVPVKKGDEVGYFAYGGSTIIMLFQPGVLFGLKVKQGNQIGVMNAIDKDKKVTPTVHHYYRYKKKPKSK